MAFVEELHDKARASSVSAAKTRQSNFPRRRRRHISAA